MSIDIKDVITLSDSIRYCVASKTVSNNLTYYYLVDVDNNENVKFCVEDNSELVEVEDKDLIKSLLPLFTDSAKDIILETLKEEDEI